MQCGALLRRAARRRAPHRNATSNKFTAVDGRRHNRPALGPLGDSLNNIVIGARGSLASLTIRLEGRASFLVLFEEDIPGS
jgi:hypothetical protein